MIGRLVLGTVEFALFAAIVIGTIALLDTGSKSLEEPEEFRGEIVGFVGGTVPVDVVDVGTSPVGPYPVGCGIRGPFPVGLFPFGILPAGMNSERADQGRTECRTTP